MYKRILDLPNLVKNRSYFLLGTRGTGKSTLIEQSLPNAKMYDLLDTSVFQHLVRNPSLIGQETDADRRIVIDEVQKFPAILE